MTVDPNIMTDDSEQILSLLYLSSPALPIGAFAYSQGLEHAIDTERVIDLTSLTLWCRDCVKFGLSRLDLPVLSRLYDAINKRNQSKFDHWNAFIFASRESNELYEEELQLGNSLKRLLTTQDMQNDFIMLPDKPSFLCCFALTSHFLKLSKKLMLLSFVWSWFENQVAVSCKAIPLGQTDAQRALLSLRADLVAFIDEAMSIDDDQIGGSLPGQALLSALHETQYSRLFRS